MKPKCISPILQHLPGRLTPFSPDKVDVPFKPPRYFTALIPALTTRAFLMLWAVCIAFTTLAQDEITLKNGDIIKASVQEVGADEVKYLKWENQEGPVYSIKKADVFMIKYKNGHKDVFNESVGPGGPPATIYFFRPRKFAGGAPEIIVGTIVPDEVIVKVHNGSWYRTEYSNFGERSFITGVYAINPESFNYKIEPGKTYFIRCTLQSQGFKMMSKLEMVDEETAKKEMAELKHQTRNR